MLEQAKAWSLSTMGDSTSWGFTLAANVKEQSASISVAWGAAIAGLIAGFLFLAKRFYENTLISKHDAEGRVRKNRKRGR